MLVLTLLQTFFWIVEHFNALVIPNVPPQVMEVVDRIFEMILDGFDILFYCFLDLRVVMALSGFTLSIFSLFLTVDIVWSIVHKMTLRRPYHE